MLRRVLIASSLPLLLNACAFLLPATDRPAGLPPTVTSMLHAANIPADAIAAIVIRLPDGATVVSHQPDRSMQPASTMKLVTTLVGLEKLGPIHRTRTELRTAAPIGDGVLRGDLILRGGGDGELSWEAFGGMLTALRHKGVRDIQGDLVLDRSLFQPPRTDIGVPPFDDSPEFAYNVIPDALLINTNLVKLALESDSRSVRARMTPALDGVSIDMQMTLVDRACEDWDEGWKSPDTVKSEDGSIRIQLRGEFPRACTASTSIGILERDEFIGRLFRTLWTAKGGSIRGIVRSGEMPTETRLLAQHRSRALADTLREINKPSDNALSRLMFLMLATLDPGAGASSLDKADNQVRAWFKQHGIADDGLVLENGSGLSRQERVRPSQLASLLVAAYRSQWAPEFLSSLPIAGLDGTMRRRLRDSPVAGRARLKTGTLNNVVALAGYVPDALGQMHVVAAIINHRPESGNISPIGRPILDALVDWVGRSGGK